MANYQDTTGPTTGPTQAPAFESEEPAFSPGQKQTPRDSAYGLDSGYVTRNKDVLGLDETAPAHTDFGTGTGAHTHSTGTGTGADVYTHNTGTGADAGQGFGGGSDIGSGSGYGASSGTRQSPHFGDPASDAELQRKYGSGAAMDTSGGLASTGTGTSGPGVTPPDANDKKEGKMKHVMQKITGAVPHRTKAPFDQGPSTGPQAHTPMSRAVAGGSHPVGEAEHALPHLSHGIPETAQSQGAVSHNKTKLKSLQQD